MGGGCLELGNGGATRMKWWSWGSYFVCNGGG